MNKFNSLPFLGATPCTKPSHILCVSNHSLCFKPSPQSIYLHPRGEGRGIFLSYIQGMEMLVGNFKIRPLEGDQSGRGLHFINNRKVRATMTK